MIRSAKHTLIFANQRKMDVVHLLVAEYRRVAQEMINWIWEGNLEGFHPTTKKLRLPKYLSSNVVNQFKTWLSARMLQCCGKQVLGILESSVAKQRKRFWVLRKLQREGKDHEALQRYIDLYPIVKPNASRINVQLDGRFIHFQETKKGPFDLWIKISSIGNKLQIRLPLCYHKSSLKWMKKGKRKNSIRLTEDYIGLVYEVPEPKKKKKGRILGCDQGYLTTASFADQKLVNTQTTPSTCPHGHDLKSICTKVSRRKPGSKGMKRAREHRKNFINWALNQINFSYVKQVNLEKVINLRKGRKQFNKSLMHWTYTQIRRKLEALSEEKGFFLHETSSVYRSQRCSRCGWVLKTNRKGKTFICSRCDFVCDSDLNAASNHSFDLPEVPKKVRQKKLNRTTVGFYWLETGFYSSSSSGHESIVRGSYQ